MSVFRILLGLGATGATAAGIFFGLGVKEKDDKYGAQMTKYRNVATNTRKLISSNSALNVLKLVVMDPESEKGGKQWGGLTKGKHDAISKVMPSDVVDGDGTKFRDWCFGKMEERSEDLKDENILTYFNETSSGSDEKRLGPFCIPEEHEVR